MTNAQYQAAARNLEGVASNWSGGSVGSGAIYLGHTDGNPYASLGVAGGTSESFVNNAANGYDSTLNASGDQRRTLTTSNGEVVWDFSGNAKEITANTYSSLTKSPTLPSWAVTEYTDATYFTSSTNRILFAPSTSTYNSTHGMGSFYLTGNGDNLFRGGDWGWNGSVGLFAAKIGSFEGSAREGFRCANTTP
jgi:hypothetical protein